MNRFVLILVLPAVLMGFDLRGLLVNPKITKGTLELKYRWNRVSRNIEQSSELRVVYAVSGDVNSLSIFEGDKKVGTVFYDRAGNVIKQEFNDRVSENLSLDQKGLFPEYKVVRISKGEIGGKSCNIVESERSHIQEDSKGNLVMRTIVKSQKKEIYDSGSGVLVEQEISTEVKQETFIRFDTQKPLNTRINAITERLQLEE